MCVDHFKFGNDAERDNVKGNYPVGALSKSCKENYH